MPVLEKPIVLHRYMKQRRNILALFGKKLDFVACI